jgi:hypothetical protein
MAAFMAPSGDWARAVADSGTDGMAGFEDARFGARGPSANFKSGGTTSFGAPRCSAATGIASCPCARDSPRALACALGFGALLRAVGKAFEGE